jgi:rubrerythrin
MEKLASINKDKVIDLLNERLAFERAGVRLYDSILSKMDGSGDLGIGAMRGQVQEHRNQEKEHEEWLEEQIRSLGGDAHSDTEYSKLVAQESEGLEKVSKTEGSLPHLFHALLSAELLDNAGWQLLLDLADRASDDDAREQFRRRLHEEDEHLIFMRRAVERFARQEVLGENAPIPSAP